MLDEHGVLLSDIVPKFAMHTLTVFWGLNNFRGLIMFITGRNEVVAKVIFLHLSVIHSVHRGVFLSACWDTTPPGPATPPPTPPGPATPPPLGPATPPPNQAPHPRPGTPPSKLTPAYGLRAAGTHPTGMHSCFFFFFFFFLNCKESLFFLA